jgi:hypothetical protein
MKPASVAEAPEKVAGWWLIIQLLLTKSFFCIKVRKNSGNEPRTACTNQIEWKPRRLGHRKDLGFRGFFAFRAEI